MEKERHILNTKYTRPFYMLILPCIILLILFNMSLYNEKSRYFNFIEEFRNRKQLIESKTAGHSINNSNL
jgi:hypothetical protein